MTILDRELLAQLANDDDYGDREQPPIEDKRSANQTQPSIQAPVPRSTSRFNFENCRWCSSSIAYVVCFFCYLVLPVVYSGRF